MRRVAIIGSGGAGKSRLAQDLGARLGLPVIHLDALFWKPGWVATPPEVWRETVSRLASGDRWIIDGNYTSSMETRLQAADTIIFLDFPTPVCVWRVFKRWITYGGRRRPDMGAGCEERLDAQFLRWVWRFRRDDRPSILQKLQALPAGKRVVRLTSGRGISRFLAGTRDRS